MSEMPILRLALPTPLMRLFDYLPPLETNFQQLTPGIRIAVPFQSRTLIGILIDVVQKSDVAQEKLKFAIKIIDEAPLLSPEIFSLCQWAADYYHYSLGEVLMAALPPGLRRGKPIEINQPHPSALTTSVPSLSTIKLNDEQQKALETIRANHDHFQVFLLHGVTGSGKTEVYLQLCQSVIARHQQVLVLVPEIGLTPQLLYRFKERFNVPIVFIHSDLGTKQRVIAWQAARTGEARIVIGTRSAVFTPFANLGLIVIDEEHDHAFKQQDRFRYHGRDVAIMRAHKLNIPIVLGSATPSLESMYNVKRDRYTYLSLNHRAGNALPATYQLIDLQQTPLKEGLSTPLLQAIGSHLANQHQVMLFLNRRGFSPVFYCTHCMHIVGCLRCDAKMVYHKTPPRLICHHCQSQWKIPTVCPQCHTAALKPIGIGTQRLEQTLSDFFPNIPIIRFDRDNTQKKGAIEKLLQTINDTPAAIILGTQMLAKGHHFPRVTLVGIIDADSGFFSADFRAAEHMGQLLLQVGGRAGRADKPGTVIIQTNHINHPLLATILNQPYSQYVNQLLKEREQANLPPFAHIGLLRAESHKEKQAESFLTKTKDRLEAFKNSIELHGPVPALLAKRKGMHCHHLIISAKRRADLQTFLKSSRSTIEKCSRQCAVRWTIDIDPLEI